MSMTKTLSLAAVSLLAVPASANQINEFEPNPAGGDPSTQSVELIGTPGASFDLYILSIENDGFNGTVDRATNVTGTYGANGLATVSIGDLENPSNTLILTDSFSGSTGSTDIDPANNGVLDLSTIGTVFDAIGVSDSNGDDASLYGAILGGTDILYNGQFEPLTVFRDSVTGVLYNTVTVDFGSPEERLGVFDTAGNEVDASLFNVSPFGTSFGAINATIIPEPGSMALMGLGALAIFRRRRSA